MTKKTTTVGFSSGMLTDFITAELDTEAMDDDHLKRHDIAPIIINFDHRIWRVDTVVASSGSVTAGHRVTRQKTQKLTFTGDSKTATLSYVPASPVGITWAGNAPGFIADGRRITVSGRLPAIGVAAYDISADQYFITPPQGTDPLDIVVDVTLRRA